MGLIYATIGEHGIAVEHFNAATSLDKFLAIAYADFLRLVPFIACILTLVFFYADIFNAACLIFSSVITMLRMQILKTPSSICVGTQQCKYCTTRKLISLFTLFS